MRVTIVRLKAEVGCIRWLIGVLTLLVAAWVPAVGMELRSEARSGLGLDSNVHESVRRERRAGDAFALLEGSLLVQRAGSSGGPLLEGRWASETYRRFPRESRLLLGGRVAWRWGDRQRWLDCGLHTTYTGYRNAEHRNLVQHELHLIRVTGGPSRRLWLQWSARGLKLATRAGGPSERLGWQLGLELRARVGRNWEVAGGFEGGRLHFERNAQDAPVGGVMILRDEDQRDRNLLWGMRLARLGRGLLQISYGYRSVASNSFGFSYHRHEGRLQAGTMLPGRVSLQVSGRRQATAYKESGFVVVQPTEEAEDPDLGARNSITLQLRRPVGGGFSAEVRGSWHHNESLVRRHYYEKFKLVGAVRYGSGS